ncbi:MAG: hypothetical protein LBL47_01430 [Lactobacillus sp.]|jgi:flagellar basal-body rod modification protein FlgD|nr:hypothetical protein [Lactobacillus sp.]
MVDVSSITGYATNTTTTDSASSTLSADMNTFLTLLTTQLKYQDPLDPMDTAQFTQQLVMYSQVEQSIQTNTKLDNLLNLSVSNLGAQAVSYIGKTAQVLGDVMPLEDGKAKATYTLDKNVVSSTIYVKDMDGNIVYTESGNTVSGTHEFTWDGKDSSGIQLEDGAYQILVSANVAAGESAANIITTIFGKVTGVASDDENIYIGLGNAVTAGLGDILTIREDDYFSSSSTTEEEVEGASLSIAESLAESLAASATSLASTAAESAASLLLTGII